MRVLPQINVLVCSIHKQQQQQQNVPGLMPAPVKPPNTVTIIPKAVPTMGATPAEGKGFFAFVTAKMTKHKKAVPKASIKNA